MASIITAIIRPHAVDAVKDALKGIGISGITLSEVKGFGRQGGKTETYRGAEYAIDFLPKAKLEVIVPDVDVDKTLAAMADAARSGKVGDGKIWVQSVDRVIRIRTGEMGDDAV